MGELGRSRLLDDGLHMFQVLAESQIAFLSQGVGGQRSSFADGFCHRDVFSRLEGANMGCQIAVGHSQHFLHFRKREIRGGGEHGDNRQSSLFMDDSIKLLE